MDLRTLDYDAKDGWQHFREWLVKNHAVLMPPTNRYEIFRADTRLGVLVGYKNLKGKNSFSSDEARNLFATYSDKKSAPPASLSPDVVKRDEGSGQKRKRIVKALMLRDGEHCFFCDFKLKRPFHPEDKKDPWRKDATIDHFLPVSKSGPNNLHNYVLACQPCNQEVDSMGVVEKVKYRERRRAGR